MHRFTRAALAASVAAAASLLGAGEARAQGLPLDRFDPAPAGDRMFGVPSPFVAGALTPHAMALLEYAHNPLSLHTVNGDKTIGDVVSSQMFLHIDASLALFNRILINADMPFALYQAGDNPKAGGTTFTSPSGAQAGDLRLGLRLRLFGEYFDPFQIAVGGYVWVPTGAKGNDSFVGSGSAYGEPQLILGGMLGDERVVWSLAGGPEIRQTEVFAGVTQGTQIDVGAGLGFLLDDKRHLQIGPEAYASFTVASSSKATQDELKRNANLEVLGDIRYRIVDDLEIAAGAGPGLTAGLGTPDVRAVFSIAYTPMMKKPVLDRDGDGIPDAADACPDVPGVPSEDPSKNGCPEVKDTDGDGIPDAEDACPTVKGVRDPDPKKNGCPADRDGDGIPDAVDACPDVKGVPSDDPKKNGCPPDRDGDGIPDAEDACPDVPGVADPDPKKNGCPKDTDGDGIPDDKDACPLEKGPADPDPKKNGCPTVHVTATEIVILEQVQFDTARSTIKKESDPLLDKVAAVFKEHPEILKVEVQGHTDNRGGKAYNKNLSKQRAEAVVKALVKRGIDKKRLVAHGYGEEVPIADNKTDEGRALNRRVQFKILEKKPKGSP
ncbi:MAG TPA: OmpA family protein [Minicystis sp.]|nr:OmpA family protein [Minicystis sp.]